MLVPAAGKNFVSTVELVWVGLGQDVEFFLITEVTCFFNRGVGGPPV